ncbi:VOC family protein [Halosegnis marinus]|uniref:VOC family protein n=1 Tax=Halosegnis marinus TaxID=3034023 RepID=UPI00361856CB
MHFDHAGIATTEADSLVFLFEDLLDCEVVHEELFDGMKLVFLDLGNGYLELLEPTGEEGAIARYLDANGPGIHHLAFATEDIDAAQNGRGTAASTSSTRSRAKGRGATTWPSVTRNRPAASSSSSFSTDSPARR